MLWNLNHKSIMGFRALGNVAILEECCHKNKKVGQVPDWRPNVPIFGIQFI